MIFPPTHQFCEIRSQNQWKNHVFQFEFYHQICSPTVWPVPVCSAGVGRFSEVTGCGLKVPPFRDISLDPSALEHSVWHHGALTSWPGERGRWGISPSDCGLTWNIKQLLRTEVHFIEACEATDGFQARWGWTVHCRLDQQSEFLVGVHCVHCVHCVHYDYHVHRVHRVHLHCSLSAPWPGSD